VSQRKRQAPTDPASEAFEEGWARVENHPLFGALATRRYLVRNERSYCPPDGWAVTVDDGWLHVHPSRRGTPEEWSHVLAHSLLHLGFAHFHKRANPIAWNAACCCVIERFLAAMKFGRPPLEMACAEELPAQSEERLYEQFCDRVPDELSALGTGGPGQADIWFSSRSMPAHCRSEINWPQKFAEGLERAVDGAMATAAGVAPGRARTPGERARRWMFDHFPLLGGLAASLRIIEDKQILARMHVGIAAVHPGLGEIYFSGDRLDEQECRFVLAHELLHVGLRHDARQREWTGRASDTPR
jgi:hypothetical protein